MRNVSIYRRSRDGKIVFVAKFDHIELLFATLYPYNTIHCFSNSFDRRFEGHIPFYWDKTRHVYSVPCEWCSSHQKDRGIHISSRKNNCYVVFDERDSLITKDRLVGLFRAYRRKQDEIWWNKWHKHRPHPGSKRKYHRGTYYRRVGTQHELRWMHAWDDEEFCPPYRAKRACSVPNYWDEITRRDWRVRSWKRYRRHQWKG